MNDNVSSYNITAFRDLLFAAFTDDELRRFCQYRSDFRPINDRFGSKAGLADMVDEVIKYCESQFLLDELLMEVKAYNPRQYERFETQLRIPARAPHKGPAKNPVVKGLRPLDMTGIFRDRVSEMKKLCDHLSEDDVRLVAVMGRSGIGKTALISRVTADLEERVLPHPNGEKESPMDSILYLGPQPSDLKLERIYTDVGRMLDERAARKLADSWASPVPMTAKIQELLQVMQHSQYLIVLDGLEHCLMEDGKIEEEGLRLFVEECLKRASKTRLVVTSREKLYIPPESRRRVRRVDLTEGLPLDDAIALLCELDPEQELGLRQESEAVLEQAVELTERIPRALENLVGFLYESPAINLSQVVNQGLLGRQVVDRLMSTSFGQLKDDGRRVMEALAVFERPVEEEAIVYLLRPWLHKDDVSANLGRLVNGYFVNANRRDGKYSLRPLDRDYIYDQIPVQSATEQKRVYARHSLELHAAEYYARIRKPEREWQSIDDLVPQLAEFVHRVRAGDHAGACRVLDSVEANYLYLWGHYSRLVEFRKELLGQLTDPVLQATNLGSLGEAYGALGHDEKAIEFYERALPIARSIRDQRTERRLLRNLGSAHRNLGNDDVAIGCFKEALSIAPEGQNQEEQARLLNALGYTYWHQEYIEQAIECYETALGIARDGKNDEIHSLTLGNFGFAYHKRGQLDQALEAHIQALSVARKIGHRQLETRHLSNIGYVYHDLGEFEQASKCQNQALEITREVGNLREESNQIDRLANTYHSLGKFTEAIEQYEKSLKVVRELQNRRGESYRLLGLSRALQGKRELAEARQHCENALSLDMPGWTIYLLPLTLGTILLYQDKPAAEACFAEAAQCARDMLKRAQKLYKAQYALAAALVGKAVCAPAWQNERDQPQLLAPALAEYQRALDVCSASGVVQDARWNLVMIRDAGIKGLEPIFGLLKNAGNQSPAEL